VHYWWCDLDDYDPACELRTLLALPDVQNVKLKLMRSFRSFFVSIPDGGARNLFRRICQIAHGRSEEQIHACAFLEDEVFTLVKVSCVEVVGDFTTSGILGFLLIPGLKMLKGRGLDIMKSVQLQGQWKDRRSDVTHLELEGGRLWRMHYTSLHTLLKYTPHLRVLRTMVPMMTTGGGGTSMTSRVMELVSPRSLQAMLEPVKRTLRELRLLNKRQGVPYDVPVMDLSGFTELRKIGITSCCLLPPGGPCEERMGLVERLPRSLEMLRVSVILRTVTACV
jgi:hypothetical protein